jgi:hypothetical protein
VETCLANG